MRPMSLCVQKTLCVLCPYVFQKYNVVQVLYKLEQPALSVRLDLMDLQGRIMQQLDGGQQDIGNYIQSYEGLESLNTGLFAGRWQSGDGAKMG
jgi:hypothetical protein